MPTWASARTKARSSIQLNNVTLLESRPAVNRGNGCIFAEELLHADRPFGVSRGVAYEQACSRIHQILPWGKHPQDVMDAFSKSIVDHYHFPHERLLEKIKHYCPGFKLSDEAAIIYKYENDALKMELARQEEMNDLIYEEYIRDMADNFEEPSEESSEDYYDDRLDLDQQHPDFYNQYPDL